MIRIALIGCNNAAADYGQLASRLHGARLVAVVDPDDTLVRRTAETLGAPLRATSFENLLRDNADAFDAVVIRCPCDLPQSVVAQAARAGKHVLLDMALLLGMPPDDGSIAACRSAGVTFMPGQVTRFLPSVAEVKDCLSSGVLGAPGLLRLHDWRPPDILNRHIEASASRKSILEAINRHCDQTIGESADSILQKFTDTVIDFPETEEDLDEGDKEIDIDEPTPSDPEQPNTKAAILEAVLPDVDLANWIFGALPTEVYATGKKGTGPIYRNGPQRASHKLDLSPFSPFSYVQVHLGYPDGGMALVDHCMMLPAGSDYFSLSLAGSNGAAYADDHHNMHLLYGGGRPTALPADRGRLYHLAELQAFVDAIEKGRPPAITADDGHKAVQVVRAAGRSLASGRAMRLIGSCYELV